MKHKTIISILLILISYTTFAQFPEDALRYSSLGIGVGARSLGLGTAYTGISNDYSAIYWNPAGLAQLQNSEFSLGLTHLSFNDKSTFFQNDKSFSTSSTKLNNFGVAYPFPTVRGSLVFAAGYNRINDYAGALSFAGFNPISSIIQYYAPDGLPTEKNPAGNLAWELYLANVDSVGPYSYFFNSKIKDSVTQTGKVLENGGLNNWSVALAFEGAKNLFLGATINLNTGSYFWQRNYSEKDLDNIYNTSKYPFDFHSLYIDQTIDATISGFSAKFGLLYKLNNFTRFGLSIKTPTWLTIDETFTSQGESFFDNGDNFKYPLNKPSRNKAKYDVVSPFVFSGGFSYILNDFLFTADVEYTDWTQMEFQNAPEYLMALNTDIKEIFQPTLNLKAGIEYEFPGIGTRARVGFAYLPSQYKDDPASFDKKYITTGLSFLIQDVVAIDLAYAYGFWNSFRVNYDRTSKVDEKISTHNILTTITYRF